MGGTWWDFSSEHVCRDVCTVLVLFICTHSQLLFIKQSWPAVLKVSLTCPPCPVNSHSPEFIHHHQVAVSEFEFYLCCLLLNLLFVKVRMSLSYRVLCICIGNTASLNDMFPCLFSPPMRTQLASMFPCQTSWRKSRPSRRMHAIIWPQLKVWERWV